MGLVTLDTDDGVGVLLINRPSALNALNREVLEELDSALDAVSKGIIDRSIGVLIISGAGEKAFVAGADIASMENMTPTEAEEFSRFGQRIFDRIETLPIPTIAAVNGYALGGGNELAMACDIRIADSNARFGQPEVNLGIIPGFGGTQRLSRIVGPKKALGILMSGRIIGAEEARAIGLVDEVTPKGEAIERAKALAMEFSKKPLSVLSAIKEAVLKGCGLPLEKGLELERSLFAACFSRDDQKEGMRAFLEKRAPRFS